MFWKVLGGIALFMMVVVLGVMVVAGVGLTAAGVAVGSIIDNLDISTVQVTDAEGNTESYNIRDLVEESGRIEVTGDNGDKVTIDLEMPRITVEEGGENASRVVIGGEDGSRFEFDANVPSVHINGREVTNIDGHLFVHPVVSFFSGLFKLVAWTIILLGVWLLLRNRQPSAKEPQEKTPSATA